MSNYEHTTHRRQPRKWMCGKKPHRAHYGLQFQRIPSDAMFRFPIRCVSQTVLRCDRNNLRRRAQHRPRFTFCQFVSPRPHRRVESVLGRKSSLYARVTQPNNTPDLKGSCSECIHSAKDSKTSWWLQRNKHMSRDPFCKMKGRNEARRSRPGDPKVDRNAYSAHVISSTVVTVRYRTLQCCLNSEYNSARGHVHCLAAN